MHSTADLQCIQCHVNSMTLHAQNHNSPLVNLFVGRGRRTTFRSRIFRRIGTRPGDWRKRKNLGKNIFVLKDRLAGRIEFMAEFNDAHLDRTSSEIQIHPVRCDFRQNKFRNLGISSWMRERSQYICGSHRSISRSHRLTRPSFSGPQTWPINTQMAGIKPKRANSQKNL